MHRYIDIFLYFSHREAERGEHRKSYNSVWGDTDRNHLQSRGDPGSDFRSDFRSEPRSEVIYHPPRYKSMEAILGAT